MLSPLLATTKGVQKPIPTMSYQELLSRTSVELYPFRGTFDELHDTPFMGLHTSGTSGHPKPIYWNHSAVATLPSFLDRNVHDPDVIGPNLLGELLHTTTVAILFPFFHVRISFSQLLISTTLTRHVSSEALAHYSLVYTARIQWFCHGLGCE